MQYSASIICLNLLELGDEIRRLEKASIDTLHADLIDGHFAKNLGLSIKSLSFIRKHTKLPIDIHLMTKRPDLYFDYLPEGKFNLLIHINSLNKNNLNFYKDKIKNNHNLSLGLFMTTKDKIDEKIIDEIRPYKILTLVVRPGFTGGKFIFKSIDNINRLNFLRKKNGHNFIIEADGAVGPNTIENLAQAGCNSVVIGTTIFRNNKVDLNSFLNFKKTSSTFA
ncbi:MAG: hypothetical protein GY718_09565 [Lentisphaerae bacterium]|nr:hypothetical protein [Lentisphaerota bacterium]